jgi:hypothetical protein
MGLLQHLQDDGVYGSGRTASGAVALEFSPAQSIQHDLTHDGSRRVSGAEKKNVQRLIAAYDLQG